MRKRRLHRRERKRRRNIIIFSMCLVFLGLSIGYAAFSTGIVMNAKGNVKQKEITIIELKSEVVTSGEGLYKDYSEEGRYIYRGANPDNYLKLGNDMYRIIAAEKDNTLKVIKNNNIGYMIFDVSNTRVADYCDNTQYGCNVWGNKYTTLDFAYNNITKLPKYVGDEDTHELPDEEATINTYLNDTWLNGLSYEIQSLIVSHIFNVGVLKVSDGQPLTTDMEQEKSYNWYGKVGLINVTDYVKASTNSACTSLKNYWDNSECYSNSELHNWIFTYPANKDYTWTISPFFSSYTYDAYRINKGGDIGCSTVNYSMGIAPVFYLSSSIKLIGKGFENEPYVIAQ